MTFRRRYSRFRPENPAVVLSGPDGSQFQAEIVNESYGGLGLTCNDPGDLEEGQLVKISLEGADYEAVIVSIRRSTDEASQIGIKWLEDESEEEDFSDDDE